MLENSSEAGAVFEAFLFEPEDAEVDLSRSSKY
jgi:hypothetical protein